jgi:hypothetical protein
MNMPSPVFKIVNLIWFQSIWISAILWQNQWLGLLALLLVVHILLVEEKRQEIGLWLIGGTVGIIVDSTLTILGIFVFPDPTFLIPIPAWLVVIWLAFLGTLRHSMSYLLNKPIIAAGLGAIAAPISYFAGMRLGAVEFSHSVAITWAVLAVCWGVLMPVLVLISNHLDKTLAGSAPAAPNLKQAPAHPEQTSESGANPTG